MHLRHARQGIQQAAVGQYAARASRIGQDDRLGLHQFGALPIQHAPALPARVHTRRLTGKQRHARGGQQRVEQPVWLHQHALGKEHPAAGQRQAGQARQRQRKH
ncbi:hypothetical protein G6F66_015313 [Rhizopus arrhizus]|nr:hypothetical protein G6F66_015313 [Rhizopus arrhizus]